MPAPTNPFPGMNPYLEEIWNEVHPRLLVYACDQIQARLPEDLRAHLEHHIDVRAEARDKREARRADVAVTESWRVAEEPDGGIAVAQPVLVEMDAHELRHIKITEKSGRVVTVIELFSPTNKLRGEPRADFRLKRRECLISGIGFVQIDLLLQGEPVIDDEAIEILRCRGAAYHVATHDRLCQGTWLLYPIPLRERLPAIKIPLRPPDESVPLELQPLVDAAYRAGRYDYFDYRAEPPGTLSPQDCAWLDEHLHKQGLR